MSALERLSRFSLLLISLLFLILGLFAGLMHLGWNWTRVQPMLALDHGPLMICGFLGTLISLERAIALGRRWGYGAPLMAGVGTLGFLTGVSVKSAMFLIALGSSVLVFIFVAVLLMQPAFHTATMGLGAVAWLVGNILWFVGIAVPQMAQVDRLSRSHDCRGSLGAWTVGRTSVAPRRRRGPPRRRTNRRIGISGNQPRRCHPAPRDTL